ncbi:MAG: SAM hydroxide adenosyltransferase [Candidatus Aminicenantaceae bacterium]
MFSDKFGNLITNIRKNELQEFLGGKKFIAQIKNKSFTRIYSSYTQAGDKEPFLIEGSSGYMEVSLKKTKRPGFFLFKKYGED